MKIETKSTGTIRVKIPVGVHLSVPEMGTSPDHKIVSVSGPTEGEVLRKLSQFYDAFSRAVFAAYEGDTEGRGIIE